MDDLFNSHGNFTFVRTTFEETVHFGFHDTETSKREWYQQLPLGSVAVRQGPHNRLFAVAMFHELHCYRLMHQVLVDRDKRALGHITHCVNYLRQLYLCRADITRESGDIVFARNFTQERQGPARVCKDWRAVYDHMTTSWLEWLDIQEETPQGM